MTKVKITVVKGFTVKEIFGENIPEYFGKDLGPCAKHKVGQEFILDGTNCPDGLCTWVYADFQRHHDWKDLRAWYLACTNGMHPVVFRVEPLSDR